MKKIMTKLITIALMLSCLIIGAYAASNNQTIQALLNKDIRIMFNNEEQVFTDVKGTRVYPITYNGTTYLPVRALSNRFNTAIEWDNKNYTIWIGDKPEIPEEPVIDNVPWDTSDTGLLANKTATPDTEKSYLVTDIRELGTPYPGVGLRSTTTGAFAFYQSDFEKNLNKSDLVWIDVSGYNYLNARFLTSTLWNSRCVIYDENYNTLYSNNQVEARGDYELNIALNGAKKIAFAAFVPYEKNVFEENGNTIYPRMQGWAYMAHPYLTVDAVTTSTMRVF